MTDDEDTLSRWHAVINYRTDSGVVDVHHDLEELEELQNLVERGPDWNTIVDIVITLQRRSNDVMTVEESEEM